MRYQRRYEKGICRVKNTDAVVFASPVYMGQMTGQPKLTYTHFGMIGTGVMRTGAVIGIASFLFIRDFIRSILSGKKSFGFIKYGDILRMSMIFTGNIYMMI